MSNKILSYMFFEDAESFERWQIDNPGIVILTVQAVVAVVKMAMQGDGCGLAADATTAVRVMVTYHKERPDTESLSPVANDGECPLFSKK